MMTSAIPKSLLLLLVVNYSTPDEFLPRLPIPRMPWLAAKLVPARGNGQVPEIIEVHCAAGIDGGRFCNPAGQIAWN
jgi:hypothetical protein